MIEEFLDKCNSCGKCQKVCPFLTTYGKPDEVLRRGDDIVFECTNCGACTIICPFKLTPSEAIHTKKSQLIQSGNVTDRVKSALNSSRGFANRGHKFPFRHYSHCEVAFWPGCGLAGVNPEVVRASTKLLSSKLNAPVGLILDCCFDPCYQMGDIGSVRDAILQIQKGLEDCAIKELITGCGNCTKVLSKFLQGIKVIHILEVLDKEDLPGLPKDTVLHHPCPSFRFNEVQQKVNDFVSYHTTEDENVIAAKAGIQNIKNSNTSNHTKSNKLPNCCGLGGGLHHLNPELSRSFTTRALALANDSNSTILTYCMGCKSKFINSGAKAYHILEGLRGVKKVHEAPSTLKKYINRLSLSLSHKINIKKLSVLTILVLAIILTSKLRAEGYISVDSILRFIEANRVLAPALFIAFYAIAPSVFIPSLALTLGAGFIWGPVWGSVFAITGATLGATVPFLLSRYIMGDWVRRRFSKERWQTLNEKVIKHGWKAVAFTRIVPIFPYPVLNYLFGITPIPLLHYVWATFVFMLPACIAYTAFGSSMGELILKGNVTGLIIGIVIASIAMLLPLALKKIVKGVGENK